MSSIVSATRPGFAQVPPPETEFASNKFSFCLKNWRVPTPNDAKCFFGGKSLTRSHGSASLRLYTCESTFENRGGWYLQLEELFYVLRTGRVCKTLHPQQWQEKCFIPQRWRACVFVHEPYRYGGLLFLRALCLLVPMGPRTSNAERRSKG